MVSRGSASISQRRRWEAGRRGLRGKFLGPLLRSRALGPGKRALYAIDLLFPPLVNLAAGLVAAALSPTRGVLHATNTGTTTWFGLAQRVFELAGADPARVLPVTTEEFPRPAPRPAFSVLDPDGWTAAGLSALPPWPDSVRDCLAQLGALSSR